MDSFAADCLYHNAFQTFTFAITSSALVIMSNKSFQQLRKDLSVHCCTVGLELIDETFSYFETVISYIWLSNQPVP